MNIQNICTNCLQGTMQNGICTCCHKPANAHGDRSPNALPEQYMLANRYYIGRVIGRGGFGITYLALDCQQGKRVIVKELYPNQDVTRNTANQALIPVKGQEAYYSKCRQRFKEEAQILYSFRQQPDILNVYQLVEANNTVYYSMEYLSGFDLKTYLQRNGVLRWAQLSAYAKKILRTLRILHGKGLIHRDISPDNIFLTSETEAKLIDFGSVRCYNNEKGLTTILKQVYAPPEQYFTHGNQGPWTDIYALSVTMYCALSGKLPQKAPDRQQMDKTVPLSTLCPQLPPHVSRAIMTGMHLKEQERFQTVEQMAQALFPGESIFQTQESGKQSISTPPTPPKPPTPPQGQGKVWYVQGIAGAFRGKLYTLTPNKELSFGRDYGCSVCYPGNSPGVSRHQCTLRSDANGNLYLKDDNSSYGTFVSGNRLKPGQWYRLQSGSVIAFAGENYYVE